MTTPEKRKPWMKWYPRDWRAETGLQLVSRAARSVWLDMLGLMHESTLIGYLLINGKKPTPEQLARVLGDPLPDLVAWLDELAQAGVYSETEDGIIYSRRMVRDHEMAEKGRADIKRRGGAWDKSTENEERAPDKDPNRVPTRDAITQRPEARGQNTDTVGAGAPTGYAPEFEGFWKAYPRSPNMSKAEAGKVWAKLAKAGLLAEQPKMLAAVEAYKRFLADQSKNRKEPHPAAHAATWLNQRRFEGFLDHAPMRNGAAVIDQGPGWEAQFPKWVKVRETFRQQHGSDGWWLGNFGKCTPLSETEILCSSSFERELLETKFGDGLERVFGRRVVFRFDPKFSSGAVGQTASFPTPEGQA